MKYIVRLLMVVALVATLQGCTSIPCSQGGQAKARAYAETAATSGKLGHKFERAVAQSGGFLTTCHFVAVGTSNTMYHDGVPVDPPPRQQPGAVLVPDQGQVRHVIVPPGQGQLR